jgi:hypothetical protein
MYLPIGVENIMRIYIVLQAPHHFFSFFGYILLEHYVFWSNIVNVTGRNL